MKFLLTALALLIGAGPASAAIDTYRQEEILAQVEHFFGQGAENLGQVVQKVFQDQGEPTGYIAGEEVSAALAAGVRYGQGTLNTKNGSPRKIYWQGPSIGIDLGLNASKVFVLIYRAPNDESLFQRFPGVEGSVFFIGGVGVNYLRSGDIVVAPIRFGAGWRLGLSAGYMDFTERMHYNPF